MERIDRSSLWVVMVIAPLLAGAAAAIPARSMETASVCRSRADDNPPPAARASRPVGQTSTMGANP